MQQQIEAAAGGANAVHHIVEVNFGANAALDAALIANNGSLIAYGSDADATPRIPFYTFMQKDVLIRAAILYQIPRLLLAKAAAEINSLLAECRLKHQIAARFPLDRIVKAHEMQESGRTIGKADLPIARDYKSSSKPVMARLPERSGYNARASAEFDADRGNSGSWDRGSQSGGWDRRGWGSNQGYGYNETRTFDRAVGHW